MNDGSEIQKEASNSLDLLTNDVIISWLGIITEVKHLLVSSPDAAAYVS